MSQYTDKINAIAEDFAMIEMFESLSALEARDGMMIVHYRHGGKNIDFRIDSKYEDTEGKAGETIIIPAIDNDYIRLKEKYTSETWGSKLGKLWKRIKGIKPPNQLFRD